MTVDVSALADLLREAAKAEILPRFRRLGTGQIHTKTDATDLVTEADEAAERFIKARLAESAPHVVFIGEESVAADPALLSKLADAETAIVVDPIDGTFNFAAGVPAFGVMASVVHRGETVAGIIYDPMGDDWVMAEKGSGAWLKRPDGEAVRLKAAPPVALGDMVGMASTSFIPKPIRAEVMGNMAKLRIVGCYRCACHEYRAFAAGYLHFLMYNKLMPWDHLAGALITQETGAYVARFDGSPYRPEHLDGGLLVASDRDSWETLRREVFALL